MDHDRQTHPTAPSRTLGLFRHRTWRWLVEAEDPDRYEAVETTDAGLRFYAWSHLHGEDGLTAERYQSFDSFEREGPARPLPDAVASQLGDWVSSYLHDAVRQG